MRKNKFGLSRHIPSEVKSAVRKRCGFGCVICAFPIVEYEHVEPVFVKAEQHDPNGIALLCPNCHSKVTRRQYSKQKVITAMKSPKALENGFVRDFLNFNNHFPEIHFGGVIFAECNIPLMIGDENILKFSMDNGVFSLSGRFYDSHGKLSLEIIDNEWLCSSNIWDMELVGPRIIIRERKRGPKLIINIENENALVIESIDMFVQGKRLKGTKDYLMLGGIKFVDCSVSNCNIGFKF
ncbi:HNH endonuclease [Hafnia alvei]|uniref:HNH endonuclease n=1 Tax=Hafnia alvei TaxID=569 RepID=UPI00061D34B1|nr:HNH endonuclease [Hafnia alvei]KKF38955.1 hypothetical protein PU01_20700 [Hafnia alvei]